ncbi:hypothetical protein RI129_011096 [Pyrocoelia pectoralis]|uniref:Major facilitator superfamily (MFS) profile domain-containing protein n=1 Tax=Pyrocoelia pectoralis TaxID=417401 RepID=A0AAN7V0D4_9COLE
MITLKGRTLQYVALCSGSLTVLSCGFHLGWSGPYLPKLLSSESLIPVTDDEGSWIAISLLIGAFCGSGLSCLLLDGVGRRKMIMFTNLPSFVSWLIVAFAQSMWELCAARFIAGLADGIVFCAIPLYFAEIADANVRGLFVSGLTFTRLIAVLLITVLGSYLAMKTVALLVLFVPLVVFFTFLWLPDTPHYYVVRGELERARESLRKFSGRDDVEERLGEILETVVDCENSKGKWVSFLSNENSRRGICILLVLRTIQNLSGYVAFVFYLPIIFEDAKDFISPITSTTTYYTLQIAIAFISMMIIDKVGRKPLLLFSIIVVAFSLLFVGVYFVIQNICNIDLRDYSWIPLVGLCLFITGYNSGLHCMSILLVGELFPIGVKVLASTVFSMYFLLSSSLTTKFFQYTKDEFGMHVPFLTFAVVCFCGLPFVVHFVSETKDKTLEEIQTERTLMIKT